jgi:hypothetical protein
LLQGIFDRKEVCHFQIRSLTLQQAAMKRAAVKGKISFLALGE